MHLSDHSLRQMDEIYVQSLEVEALRGLSLRLLADLKEARDRLNQGPENSSRPPSSRLPWDRKGGKRDGEAEPDADPLVVVGDRAPEPAEAQPAEATPVRRPGKQRGAPGKSTRKLGVRARAVAWLVETYGLTVEQAKRGIAALFSPDPHADPGAGKSPTTPALRATPP